MAHPSLRLRSEVAARPDIDGNWRGLHATDGHQSGGQFVQTLWPKVAVAAQNDRPSRPIQSGNGLVKAHDESQLQGKADSRPTQSPTQSDDPVTRLLSVLRRAGALSPQALRLAPAGSGRVHTTRCRPNNSGMAHKWLKWFIRH